MNVSKLLFKGKFLIISLNLLLPLHPLTHSVSISFRISDLVPLLVYLKLPRANKIITFFYFRYEQQLVEHFLTAVHLYKESVVVGNQNNNISTILGYDFY